MATQKLDPEESQFNRIELSPGYPRKVCVVSESGLYKLVMRSDKAEAKAFQDWGMKEVKPTVCKDSGYVMGQEDAWSGRPTGWCQRQWRCPRAFASMYGK